MTAEFHPVPSTQARPLIEQADLQHIEKKRIALYSHDTMGIGHLRRNMLVAQALSHAPFQSSSLIIAGAHEASMFRMPANSDCLILPSIEKGENGSYGARSLGVSFERLIDIRSRTIQAALESFQPDLFLVDKVPRGVGCELDRTLQSLKAGGKTSCILGLRDVLDDPENVRREWATAENDKMIDTYYDAIWIYGDPAVYNAGDEYGFSPKLAAKTTYTGYLDPRIRCRCSVQQPNTDFVSPDVPADPYVLCLVGGGQDGDALIDVVSQATLPTGMQAVLLLGPYASRHLREKIQKRIANQSPFQVLDFVTDPERFIASADRIIAMGGYNTICEILAYNKRALIVPRIKPRREQYIRAERLRDKGLLDLLHPDQLCQKAIEDWLRKDMDDKARSNSELDMQGHLRVASLVTELLVDSNSQAETSMSEDPQFADG